MRLQFSQAGFLARTAMLVCAAAMLSAANPLFAQRLTLDEYRKRYQDSRDLFLLNAEQFADNLKMRGLLQEARIVRQRIEELEDSQTIHQPLPRTLRPPINPVATPETVWRQTWRRMQDEHAAELFSLSQKLAGQQHIGLGYRIAGYVLRINPDHEQARMMLGYLRSDNEWLTPFEKMKKESGEIWHDQFGWIHKDDLSKYEQGLRPFGERWLKEDLERNVRLAKEEPWEVRTEHWVIRTDHSLEKGVEVAKRLEDFLQFFVREFPDLFDSRSQMNELLSIGSNGRARVNRNPMKVNYFSSREGYINRLKDVGPLIGSTNGIYLQKFKTSFFYARPDNPDEEESTIYHEATHQILQESRSNDRDVAQDQHFWVVEGFACYMESYRNVDGVITIGDPNFIRFNNAMVRLISDRFFVRLERMAELGQVEFQRVPELPQMYSQASGMVHFFIHAHDGAYRGHLGNHIAAIYSPRIRRERDIPTLDELIGKSYKTLDEEYVTYIARLAEEVFGGNVSETTSE